MEWQILIIAGTGIAGLAFSAAGAMMAYHSIQHIVVGRSKEARP